MRSLKDYLNNTQQYESILNPDQNQVMDQMTDDMIRQRIREYCTFKRYSLRMIWPAADFDLQITKVDKDDRGWYIETRSDYSIHRMDHSSKKSFHEYCISLGQKIDKQKGFLVMDQSGPDVYFRWRKHDGDIIIEDALYLETTEGFPEELDVLDLVRGCSTSQKLDVRNNIKITILSHTGDIKISGKGCKNVIIYPNSQANATAPSGVKIHHPKTHKEYLNLIGKLD